MPRVSIGLPVYNGENFIKEALDSLLAQTFEDFELIISDNASTDETQEICRAYAARDRRVLYYRNKKNLGANSNWNRVFHLSTGKYFKWAAHDDTCAPEYLERCVEVLDGDPSVVICHPKTGIIDEHGKHVRDHDDFLDFRSPKPHDRFRKYLFRRVGMWTAIHGLMRAIELKKTLLYGGYSTLIAADQVMLGELVLRGKFYQVSERLFFRRHHPKQGWRVNPSSKAVATWTNPSNAGKIILPLRWKFFFEYLLAIKRAPLSWYEQTWCYLYMMMWADKNLVWRPLNSTVKRVYRGLSKAKTA